MSLPRFTHEMDTPRPPGRVRSILAATFAIVLLVAGCGDDSLLTLGQRSSQWVNEPTVVTTTTVATTIPVVRPAANLIWYNDDLGLGSGDAEAVVAQVFSRRQGDRFIQASRGEIIAVLPDITFPESVPPLSEYVSSQLVIDNNGQVSSDPSVAFGIWTAEPYTRSRSVAQMIVIRIYRDAETAAELGTDGADLSCARFASAETSSCDIEEIAGRRTWVLGSTAGTTMIWFDGIYRYEMFGRPFAPLEALRQTAASMAPIPLPPTPDTTP